MSISQRLRETSPYRLLLIATLAAIVPVQVVAMALVTRSQVQKAEAHYAAERAASSVAVASRTPSRDVVKVGYVASR
jgi:hypothetical protein